MAQNNNIRRFDEWTKVPMLKQRRYEKRNAQEAGRCRLCPRKRLRGRPLCRICRDKRRVMARRSWQKKYANPEFRTRYLEQLKAAYHHYRGLGYSSLEARKLAKGGIKPSIGHAPPKIPIWKEPDVTFREKTLWGETKCEIISWKFPGGKREYAADQTN